jgi:hypothetical protein
MVELMGAFDGRILHQAVDEGNLILRDDQLAEWVEVFQSAHHRCQGVTERKHPRQRLLAKIFEMIERGQVRKALPHICAMRAMRPSSLRIMGMWLECVWAGHHEALEYGRAPRFSEIASNVAKMMLSQHSRFGLVRFAQIYTARLHLHKFEILCLAAFTVCARLPCIFYLPRERCCRCIWRVTRIDWPHR